MSTNTLILGSKIPTFSLKGIDEKIYSNRSFIKRGLIVIFSCNHCPYVQAYEQRIINLQKKFEDDIQFLAINANDAVKYPDDSFEKMKIRARKIGFNFPYLHDETQEVAKLFDATHTPEIFFFNDKRELIFHGKIDDYWQDEKLAKAKYLENSIIEFLNGEEISVPETFTIGCTIKWK